MVEITFQAKASKLLFARFAYNYFFDFSFDHSKLHAPYSISNNALRAPDSKETGGSTYFQPIMLPFYANKGLIHLDKHVKFHEPYFTERPS